MVELRKKSKTNFYESNGDHPPLIFVYGYVVIRVYLFTQCPIYNFFADENVRSAARARARAPFIDNSFITTSISNRARVCDPKATGTKNRACNERFNGIRVISERLRREYNIIANHILRARVKTERETSLGVGRAPTGSR